MALPRAGGWCATGASASTCSPLNAPCLDASAAMARLTGCQSRGEREAWVSRHAQTLASLYSFHMRPHSISSEEHALQQWILEGLHAASPATGLQALTAYPSGTPLFSTLTCFSWPRTLDPSNGLMPVRPTTSANPPTARYLAYDRRCRDAPLSHPPRCRAARRTITLFLPHLLLPRKSPAFTPKLASPLRLITTKPTHPFLRGFRLRKGKLDPSARGRKVTGPEPRAGPRIRCWVKHLHPSAS